MSSASARLATSQTLICGLADELSFAIVIELQDDRAPAAKTDGVTSYYSLCTRCRSQVYDTRQDPPAWVPAIEAHTTAAVTDKAELHMVRVVETGIINVSYSDS